ncbi:MAG: 16S rRNA (guanine(966)-N(2))-methyltransferase RsmD, partial [Candidatus Omnitrophica bacterium]|nr:16S rRNA (guanine(966)-N(2))-methyltransferase RsmD [Candidatus Omnitrophota bacterium]
MRILSGELKGRNILSLQGIRPVSERVRKSCFDILGSQVKDKKILDLFAGSGSLGFEAISRGGRECVFIDSQRRVLSVVEKNISCLGLELKTRAYLKDSFQAVKDFSMAKASFDLVFLDPPYYRGMLTKSLQQLGEYDIVSPSGYLVAF